MDKPKVIDLYAASVTDDCERMLVTLLSGLGPWKDSVCLVGGLAPRYLVQRRPPEVRGHAGTADVDLVIDLAVLADTEAYKTLEDNLKAMGFERAENAKGAKVNWRWQTWTEDGAPMILEFLSDDPSLKGGALQELPTEGNLSAINIPHAAIVHDLHDKIEVTAARLTDGAMTTETIAYANIVSFTCLKAFAFDHRGERKDAHDLVYCLENYEGEPPMVEQFAAALAGAHAEVVDKALNILVKRFTHLDPDIAYRRDGPTSVALFEYDNPDGDTEIRELQVLAQRQAVDIVGGLLKALGYGATA
jgi:hypothetical protein